MTKERARVRKCATRRVVISSIALVALFLTVAESFACPVCFGESDDPIINGLEKSILFMIGITYSLILGGIATFFILRARARRLAEQTAIEGAR